MGSSDCHETETRVHGRAVPTIATAPAETGRNRGTGREATVSVTKLKVERYRKGLNQKRSAIFCRERTCYLSERRPDHRRFVHRCSLW